MVLVQRSVSHGSSDVVARQRVEGNVAAADPASANVQVAYGVVLALPAVDEARGDAVGDAAERHEQAMS
jgi:hypothetical protein